MKIKPINLTVKEGGNGYTSSYSLSIGKKEAEACGFLLNGYPKVLCKIIDDKREQIVIKVKRASFTEEKVKRAIELAERCNMPVQQSGLKSISMQEGLDDFIARHKGEVQLSPEEKELADFFQNLSIEELSDFATLMNIGRNWDANFELEKEERFADYWSYILKRIPNEKEELCEYILEKIPLAEYLRRGMIFLNLPVGVNPAELSEEEMMDMADVE